MKRFKSGAQTQRLLSILGRVANRLRIPADASAGRRRDLGTAAMAAWREPTQSAA